MKVEVYAANHKQRNVREMCSSGAVFIELARYVIHQGGVVFGAKFDNNWNVVHDFAETEEKILDFIGSKYVQSRIGNMYNMVKKFLNKGRQVLFSGTPCQIEGLRKFLGKEYDNLLLVDLVCHGVPSPKVWEEYLEKVANHRRVKEICFRDKTEGWENFSLRIDFSDGSVYKKKLNEDLFLKGFLQNIYLRPSCYECQFKGVERNSDITIADFWGAQNIVPYLYDDRGTSMVIIQSKKGKKIWFEVQYLFDSHVVDTDVVERCNSAAIFSPPKTEKRDQFFARDRVDIDFLKKLTQDSLIKKAKRFLKKNRGRV